MTLAMTSTLRACGRMRGDGIGVTPATAAGGFAMSEPARPLYCIDAGGSRTSVRAWNGEHWSLPSLNPSSVGQASSNGTLADLFRRIPRPCQPAPSAPVTPLTRPAIWLASASVDRATADAPATPMHRCGAGSLLYAESWSPTTSHRSFSAHHRMPAMSSPCAALAQHSSPRTGGLPRFASCCGGCEYLGSDEGSAFDLGMRGLRTAVCGLDGRGQHTALSELLAAEAGVPVPELSRKLARMPFPKAAVAALAPVVLRAWLDGDPATADLVDAVIGELVVGIRAAHDAAAVAPGWHLSVAGGVVIGCPDFFDRVAAAATGLGARHVMLVSDPTTVLLGALARLAGTNPVNLSDPRIGQEAWYLDFADRTTDLHGKTD